MTEMKLDGGSAFPHDSLRHEGLSVRDYFAASALRGILATQAVDETLTWFDLAGSDLAAWSYGIADAMLKAREK